MRPPASEAATTPEPRTTTASKAQGVRTGRCLLLEPQVRRAAATNSLVFLRPLSLAVPLLLGGQVDSEQMARLLRAGSPRGAAAAAPRGLFAPPGRFLKERAATTAAYYATVTRARRPHRQRTARPPPPPPRSRHQQPASSQ